MMGKGERHRGIKKGGDHTGLEIIVSQSAEGAPPARLARRAGEVEHEARIYNGEKTISLTSGAGKTGQLLVKELN